MPRKSSETSKVPAGAPMKRTAAPVATRRKASTRKKLSQPHAGEDAPVPPPGRERLIAEAAYFIAESEGFPEGRALEHWLAAEVRIDAGPDCIERTQQPAPQDRLQ